MNLGVVVFPGSNCDDDMIHVLGTVMGGNVTKIWHKEESLVSFGDLDCIIIPGGFSYGDYLRSGAIAKFSPIMKEVVRFAKSGGFVVGICNGFQILCEAELLPGVLLPNVNQKFICKNIFLKTITSKSAITHNAYKGQVLKIPIAHADGRFHTDPQTVKSLQDNDQILFQYCDQDGNVNEESNINGSLLNIAGICNKERNVFGMMPHPERASENELGNTDGKLLFDSLFGVLETKMA